MDFIPRNESVCRMNTCTAYTYVNETRSATSQDLDTSREPSLEMRPSYTEIPTQLICLDMIEPSKSLLLVQEPTLHAEIIRVIR